MKGWRAAGRVEPAGWLCAEAGFLAKEKRETAIRAGVVVLHPRVDQCHQPVAQVHGTGVNPFSETIELSREVPVLRRVRLESGKAARDHEVLLGAEMVLEGLDQSRQAALHGLGILHGNGKRKVVSQRDELFVFTIDLGNSKQQSGGSFW